jgi:hypothetical protein
MRIVRPYGSSRSKQTDNGFRRVLVENTEHRTEHEIPDFAHSHDALIIAQWISTIDKIARKPMPRKKPTQEQRDFRQRLGEACWQRLTQGGHLPGAKGDDSEFLKNLWWFKIHPYGSGTEEPRPGRHERLPPPKAEGRWYGVFVGDRKPDQADVSEVARRIETHLYESEYRLGSNVPTKHRGKIEARARSISLNVLGVQKHPPAETEAWTAQDIDTYRKQGDPAREIHDEAEKREDEDERVNLAIAGEVLFRHWAKVFRVPETGEPMSVEQARTTHPGMFALHMQLKQCYRRLLKRTRKGARDSRNRKAKGSRAKDKRNAGGRKLSALLPCDLDAALRLSQMQTGNADLGHLVRLGKVIHYTASDGRADRPAAIADNWRENVDSSRFWTSDGQAEIKRSEAFVRMWRQALVLAGLTLKDWVSMREPFRGDILGRKKEREQALQPNMFEQGRFDRKLLLLFGSRAPLFNLQSKDDCLELLKGLIDGARNLRHAVFHFKGRGQLLDKLAKLPTRFGPATQAAAQRL